MTELFREHYGIDHERTVVVHIAFPVNLPHLIVHLVGIVGLEFANRHQNLHSSTQTEVGTIQHLFIAGKRHHTNALLNVLSTYFL